MTDCVHRFVLGASDTRERNRGRCRKCGTTKHFGDTRYDISNMTAHHRAPAQDTRTKALLYIKQHDGVRVEWDAFRSAVGCSYTDLGAVVKELKNEGVVLELDDLTYALVEPDSG